MCFVIFLFLSVEQIFALCNSFEFWFSPLCWDASVGLLVHSAVLLSHVSQFFNSAVLHNMYLSICLVLIFVLLQYQKYLPGTYFLCYYSFRIINSVYLYQPFRRLYVQPFVAYCTTVLCEASALFLQLWVGLTCIWLVSAPFWSINAVFLVQYSKAVLLYFQLPLSVCTGSYSSLTLYRS